MTQSQIVFRPSPSPSPPPAPPVPSPWTTPMKWVVVTGVIGLVATTLGLLERSPLPVPLEPVSAREEPGGVAVAPEEAAAEGEEEEEEEEGRGEGEGSAV
ncbi:uncharacterized protein Z520_11137 [Fonsecaea multimorphosa CBS 102226]|uniref:Uncharacterized protein n=1 Tax=Fonsecaea multimorphosa CBS 102226 TaxID=1442371 RepID=A0A0D2GU90_9EURO|nr:uncharacterized protein Z520_11137 [Fonsecaea multimorphosa CBS 102226]KIX93080.1 hypothetical protein Z520_11137 [Fonsecaea multimorphosa CBS 102226]